MWCIGALTEDYLSRMYALLELYARSVSQSEPVICIDEKSLQLIGHSREPLPMASHQPTKQDYEYERNGTERLTCSWLSNPKVASASSRSPPIEERLTS